VLARIRDLSRLAASSSVIPAAESTFAWDEPAFVQRTAVRGSSSQSAKRRATARFARPPEGGARQLTTQHFRQMSQSMESEVLPGFTQREIFVTRPDRAVDAVPDVLSCGPDDLEKCPVRRAHSGYPTARATSRSGAPSGELGATRRTRIVAEIPDPAQREISEATGQGGDPNRKERGRQTDSHNEDTAEDL